MMKTIITFALVLMIGGCIGYEEGSNGKWNRQKFVNKTNRNSK